MGNRISTEDLYKITQSLADRAVSDVKKRREDERKREEAIKKNREERLAAAAKQNRIPNYKGGSLWDQYKAALASGEAKNASDFITKRDARNAAWNKVGAETLNDDMEALAKSISSTYGTQFDPSKYYSQETINGSSDQVKKMRDRLNALAEYYNTYGGSDEQKKAVGEQIKAYDSELKFLNDLGAHYGQYSSPEAYETLYDNGLYTEKYQGKNYSDIQNALKSTTNDREKAWLEKNADSFMTAAEAQAEIDRIEKAMGTKNIAGQRWTTGFPKIENGKLVYNDNLYDKETGKRLQKLEAIRDSKINKETLEDYGRYLGEANEFATERALFLAKQNNILQHGNETFGVFAPDAKAPYAKNENAQNEATRLSPEKLKAVNEQSGRAFSFLENADWATDDEKKIYDYLLYYKGGEEAKKYLRALSYELNRRAANALDQTVSDMYNNASGLGKTVLNIGSLGMNIIGNPEAAIDTVAHRIVGERVDPNSNNQTFRRIRNVIREKTGADLAKASEGTIFGKELFGENAANMLYGAAMSSLDSLLGGFTFGEGYTAVMGGGAMADEAERLYNKGASDSQIFNRSFAAGLAEYITEKVSMDNLLKAKSPANGLQVAKEILKQAGIEGSEEMASDVLNLVTDSIIMADRSEMSESIQKYKDGYIDDNGTYHKGVSEKEAQKLAWQDFFTDAMADGLAGALSGGMMSAGPTIASYKYSKNRAAIQIPSIDPGNAEGLVSNARINDISVLADVSEALKNGDAEEAGGVISEGIAWYEFLKKYGEKTYGKNQWSEVRGSIDDSISKLKKIQKLVADGSIDAAAIDEVLKTAETSVKTTPTVDMTSANDEKLFSLLAKGEPSNSVIEKNILKDRGTLAAFERLTGLRIGGTTVSQKRAAVREAFRAVSSSTETLKAAQNAIESGATATEGHKNAAVIIDQAIQANRADNSRLRNSEKVKSAETKAAIDATNRQHRFLETVRNYVINGGDLSGFTESPAANVSGEGGTNSSEAKTTQETAKKRVRADFSAYQDERYSAEEASALANLNSKEEQDAFFRSENARIEQEIKNIESSDSITAEEKAQRIGELKEAASRNYSLAKAMDDFREMGRLVRAGEVDKVVDSLRKPLKKMGINIEVVDNIEAAEGMKSGAYFDKRTNTIKVSRDWNMIENVVKLELAADGNGFVLNPGKSVSFDRAVTQTIAHEIAHADSGLTLDFIKAVAGTQYDAFDLKGRLEHPDDRSWRSEDAQKEANWRRYVDSYTEQVMLEMKGTEEQRRASAEKVVNDLYIFEDIMADMFGAAVDDMGHSGKAGENIFWAMNRNKPGIIKRILNALERFIARIRGKDAYLAVEQRQAAERLRDMLTGELKRAYGTDVKGEAAVENDGGKRHSLAGANSRTADLNSLGGAYQMYQNGVSMDTIRKRTGWWLGKDGKWRYEISDKEMRFNPEGYVDNPQTVGDYVKHDRLFAAYPWIMDVNVLMSENVAGDPNSLGRYVPSENFIELKTGVPTEKTKHVLIHELQHAIQNKEHFTSGTNSTVTSRYIVNLAYNNVKNNPEFKAEKSPRGKMDYIIGYLEARMDANFDDIAKYYYSRNHGEIEAQYVDKRLDMSDNARKAEPIVNYGDVYTREDVRADFIDNLKEMGYNEEQVNEILEKGIPYDNKHQNEQESLGQTGEGRKNLAGEAGRLPRQGTQRGERREVYRTGKVQVADSVKKTGQVDSLSDSTIFRRGRTDSETGRNGVREAQKRLNEVSKPEKRFSLSSNVEQIIENDSGEFVAESNGNGGTRWSLSTYESSGRETLRQYLDGQVSESGLTEADAKAVLDSMDEIYEICRKYEGEYAPFGAWSRAEVVIDEKGNPVFSVVKPNGEYAMNLDFSLVCKKRRALDAVLNRLIETGAINDFGFGQEEIVRVNEIIREHGFEIACDMCFVDAKRYRQAGVADQFVDLYNSIVKSMAKDGQEIDYFNFANDSSLSHTEGGIDRLSDAELDFSEINEITKPGAKKTVEYRIAQYLKTHPSDRKLLSRGDFMSTAGFDAVKVSKPGILKLYNSKKGTGGPKAAQSDVQYLNDILSSKKFNRSAAYDVGGVRVQSFSDYVPRLVFDYVQMIGDLAAKRLPAHAYTKEPLFAKQFGLTGMKINMSLMPAKGNGKYAGLNADGSYAWARESFPAEEAFRIQADPEYGKNVGTIAVGISDEHIWKMLSDPYIRMVIPYHKSGINPAVAVKLKIGEYTDYTGQQNTRRRDGKQLTKAELKNIPDINRLMHRDGLDAVEASRRYVEWCEDNGYIPKFEKFAYMTDSDGNRVFNENYYKLLEDFTTMVDGEFHPQGDVTATFPGSDSAFGSMADLIKEGLEEDAVTANRLNAEVDGLAEEVRSALGREESGKRFSLTRANDEYMKAVESGNVEEQQRLVDEAAKNAGYDSPKVFHQTGERFWEFKTDNPVAGAYDSETPNGIFFKSNDHDIGVGGNYVETGRGGEIQMAAYLRMENTLHFSDRKEANAWYVKNVPGYEAAQTEMQKAVEPFDRQIDALDDEFFVNDSISEEEYERQWNNLIEKLRETENKYRKRLREILDDYFLTGNSGYDSIELDYDGHRYIDGKRENVHTYIVFDGSQVKSADPITYDDSGNVIPLTERFDSGNRDIRWSLAGTNEDRAEAAEFSDSGIRYSLRKEDPPKKTLTGYKVFVVKNGKLYPPMVANPDAADTPVGVWLNADIGAQAPDSKTGRKQVKAGGKGTQGGSGSLAFRPGWHLGETPLATQFDRTNPETGKRELFPENFVWAECEIAADKNYQEEAMSYGYTKSGKFQHSLAGLPKIPVDGYYKYRTNPNPDTVPWLITGAMKVNRLLDDAEVNRILESKGLPPKNRVGGNKTLADLGLEETAKRLNGDGDGNIRYSLVKSAQSELKALQKENEKLRQDVDDLKQELQLTHGRKLSRDALISSIQKTLIDRYGVKLSAKELYPHVTNLYDMFYNNTVDGKRLKKDERVDTIRIIEEMDKIVDAVIENAVGVDDTYVEMKKLLPELRNTKLVVPVDARADAAQSAGFENWAEFRKANFGRVGFANEGLPVDTYYMELSERYPELFPDGITHPGEQAAHIADVVNTIRESGINEYQLYDIEDERIRTSIKNDVMDIIGNAEKLQTFADRAAQKVEDTKLAEAMHYGADIAKLKRLNAEKVADIKAENRKRLSDMRRKYQDRVESVRERYAEARANRSEKQKQTVLRNKVLRKYTEASSMLDRPTTENHFTEAMRKPIMEFLAAVDITTGKSVAKQGVYDRILRVIEAANNMAAEGGKNGLDIAETDLNVQEKQLIVDSGLLERMSAWVEVNKGKKLTELSSAQLEELNGIFNQLKHLTAEIKRLYDPREGLAAKSWQAQKEIGLAQTKERKQVLGAKTEKAREKYEQIHFGALDAAGYYNTLGSDTMTAQFERFRQCQNRFSENIQVFTDRLGEIVDGAIPKDEHGKNAKEVTLKLSHGTLTATPAQLMSVYLMLNQEDSRRCLFNEAGGVIIGKFTAEKPKDGKAHIAGKRTFAQSGRLVLNEADAAKITAALTDGQRKRADAISALLNNEAARLGNEVSMAMYGYKKYTTENYFPMRTADDYRAIADNPNYEMNLLGLSFTKERTGRAGKALVAEDIYDVIGRHLTNMAQYNAFAQELDNAKKMYSLRLGDGTSLKQRIIRSYGREADTFYNKLINNLSGVQMYTNNSAEALSDKLLSNYKAAAVAGNVSVVLKQPMSIFRALPEFSLAGLKKSMAFEDILNLSPKQLKANTAEMLKYSGIARLKAWGSSENMTRKSFESLYNDNSDTARQKINEFLTSGAENADMWTWAKLWRMSKAEIDAQGKYTAGSKEYFEAVDRKFSDVIGKTQVVQSALDSSMAVQNAKGFGKFLFAFQNEPLKQYSYLISTLNDARRGKPGAKKKLAKVIASSLANTAAVSAISTFMAWLRGTLDRDDDDELLDDLMKEFAGNSIDDLLSGAFAPVWQYIDTIMGAINSGVYGNTVERLDMAALADLGGLINKYFISQNGGRPNLGTVQDIVNVASNLFGLPAKNIFRDVKSVIDRIILELPVPSAAKYNYLKAWKGVELTNKAAVTEAYYDVLRDAVDRGRYSDYVKIKRDMIYHGYTETKIKNAVMKSSLMDDLYELKKVNPGSYKAKVNSIVSSVSAVSSLEGKEFEDFIESAMKRREREDGGSKTDDEVYDEMHRKMEKEVKEQLIYIDVLKRAAYIKKMLKTYGEYGITEADILKVLRKAGKA